MSSQPDGVNDMVSKDMQAALALAARMGESLARRRAEMARQQTQVQQQQRRALEERFEADRAMMRNDMSEVEQDRWWAGAGPDEVGHHYMQALQWEAHDDVAREAAHRIEREVQRRHGVTVDSYLQEWMSQRAAQSARVRETGPEFSAEELAEARSWAEVYEPRLLEGDAADLGTKYQDRFSYLVWLNEDTTKKVSPTKDDVLKMISEIDADDVSPVALSDYAGWAGNDVDVDRALADKLGDQLPSYAVMRAQTAAERVARHQQAAAEQDQTAAAQLAAEAQRGRSVDEADASNAAAEAEQRWDSGDRRQALADTLMQEHGDTDAGREGVTARMVAETDQGTEPSRAVHAKVRRAHASPSPQSDRVRDRGLSRG